MQQPTLILQPLRNGLAVGQPLSLDLLVRVQAPEAPVGVVRPALNLALVLDRSGSMDGQPLEEAKRCAQTVIRKLGSEDRVAVVVYDNRVQIPIPAQFVQDAEGIANAIANVQAGGNTNLHAGWAEGIRQLKEGARPGVLSRVLLLSDGQANAGITNPQELADFANFEAQNGLATSTYGLGTNFEEGLMTQMAKGGSGRSYYGETAEDLLEPFLEEYDFLRAACTQGLQLRMKAGAGLKLVQRNGYRSSEEGVWTLPDIAYGAEAWAAFRVEGTAEALQALVKGETAILLETSLTWVDLEGKANTMTPVPFSLPMLKNEAHAALPEDPLVKTRFTEVEAGRLEEEAYRAANAGDWERVQALLDLLKSLGKDNPWILAKAVSLQLMADSGERALMTKELHYGSLSSTGSLRSATLEAWDGSSQRYYQQKPRQGKGTPMANPPPPDPTSSQGPLDLD